MIKKFIAIKNVGKFKNTASPGTPELREFTFIFGPNGYGKTTLGAVLRSLQSGEAEHIMGRRTLSSSDLPSVEFLLTSGLTRFNGKAWSQTDSSITIFDGEFVAENVHSGEAVGITHRRNLYRVIIGEEGTSLAEQDAQLANESRRKTIEISAAKRGLESHIPAGMSIETFTNLPNPTDLELLIRKQEQEVLALQQSEAIRQRPLLNTITTPTLPNGFESSLSRTIDDVSDNAELILTKHLEAHEFGDNGRQWIRTGLAHSDGGSCPFCGQNISGLSLIASFKAVFSEEVRQLSDGITAMQENLEESLGSTASGRWTIEQERHISAVRFWTDFCEIDPSLLEVPSDILQTMSFLFDACTALMSRKNAAPLKAVPFDDAFQCLAVQHQASIDRVIAFNIEVAAANTIIEARKAAVNSENAQSSRAILDRLLATKTRHGPAVSALCDDFSRLSAEKTTIEVQKEAVRLELNAHTESVVKPYEARINELLTAFNAGFAIAETRHSYPSGLASSSYQLVVDGEMVPLGDADTPRSEPSFKNTLSSGDRTTLALAFFLAHLERDPQLASKVVVFDDPFNSQDAFRRRQTVLEIMKIGRRCGQVVVLSHDQYFLKQLWDKVDSNRRIALAVVNNRSHGSKLLKTDLDEACRGTTTADIDDLQAFLTTGTGGLTDIARKLRVVLESHCRVTYNGSFLDNDWLGGIVGKIRDMGDEHPAWPLYEELDEINEYSKEFHHGDNNRHSSAIPIDSTELTGFVSRTLRIVNASTA